MLVTMVVMVVMVMSMVVTMVVMVNWNRAQVAFYPKCSPSTAVQTQQFRTCRTGDQQWVKRSEGRREEEEREESEVRERSDREG